MLGLISVCAGCGQKSPPKTKDFSKSDSIRVILGGPEKEYGNGLQHVYFEQDGLTSATTVGGVTCRYLKLDRDGVGYFYFIIDPTFKNGGLKDVDVEVDYFDAIPGAFGLEFDASRTQKIPNAAYAGSGQTVRLTGSKTWESTMFHVRNASFGNAQNSRSDFRLWVRAPEFYVRRVVVAREGKLDTFGEFPPTENDFSNASAVSIALGDPGEEYGNGLRHLYFAEDGLTATTNLNGALCRYLKLETDDVGYFYFIIVPGFKKRDVKNVQIEVEYFDDGEGTFGLEFDASKSKKVKNPAYVGSGQTVRLAGSKTWQTALFQIHNASFRNAQNAGADFRLSVRPPELCVRRVTMTRIAKQAPP